MCSVRFDSLQNAMHFEGSKNSERIVESGRRRFELVMCRSGP